MSISAKISELSRESAVPGSPAWSNVVDRIKRGDASAMEELYKKFSTGIRFLFHRQLGIQDLDDKVHDVFMIVTEAICNGELREPERLMGYVHTVVRRQVASHIDRLVQNRRNCKDVNFLESLPDKYPDPGRKAIKGETVAVAMSVLQTISKRDREVLTRFYLNEEFPDDICRDMGLSDAQFRLIKSRAKARFGELGKRRLALRAAPMVA
jgi:RNA polymerase sigma factor (sigma-70 family)